MKKHFTSSQLAMVFEMNAKTVRRSLKNGHQDQKPYIIPYVEHIREKIQKPFASDFLMMDSCSSHYTDNVLKILGENNILIFFYLSNTTNLFQALYLSLFDLLKIENQYYEEKMTESKFADSLFKSLKSYEHTSTKFNACVSFEKAGLSINIEKKIYQP